MAYGAAANVVPFPVNGPPRQAQAYRGNERTDERAGGGLSLKKLRKQLNDYMGAKQSENDEAQESDRYYNAVQWREDELGVLKAREQPPIVYNRIKRKINTVCGILERGRQDPKAYPVKPGPNSNDGAELATKVLRHCIGWDWVDISTNVARRCAVRAISGVEIVLNETRQGDVDFELDEVDQRDFFYDPRSKKLDFSDARFMGTTRWIDKDEAIAKWPDYEDEIETFVESAPAGWDKGDTRKLSWTNKDQDQVRIVDHWYQRGTRWFYAIYLGEVILEEGESPFTDTKGASACKFIMVSCEIDQDNDRYTFFRDLKGPQDEINHRRSKGIHGLNTRRVMAEKGAVDDVERARREIARSDGWVEYNKGFEIEVQTNDQDIEGNLQLLQEAKAEIDTYGPNPGLIGTEVDASSGRAIALLQAAGIAEMGNFIMAFKHWKLRVYRMLWSCAQTFWQAERWIRVTEQEGMAEFVQVNGWEHDPLTGQVTIINQLADLDVEIIIDEGPDTINSQADTFDTILAMAAKGSQVPPQVIIQLSPLPSSLKKQLMETLEKSQQPSPMDMQTIQLKLQEIMSKIQVQQSQALLNQAKAASEGMTDGGPAMQIDTPADMAKAKLDSAKADEIHHKIQVGAHSPAGETMFDQLEKAARTRLTNAQTAKVEQEALTIAQAPPGYLQTPPPKPPAAPRARAS
jgi:hypothetical protein